MSHLKKNIFFKKFTMKFIGQKPTELKKSSILRVPFLLKKKVSFNF